MLKSHAFALLALAAVDFAPPGDKPPPACVGFAFIFFAEGSYAITAQSRAMLDNFARLLKESAVPSRVEVAGHADRVGDAESNLRLSRRRAEAVRDYLVATGHPKSRVDLAANGETGLLVETPDATPEPQNRNVRLFEEPAPAEWKRRKEIWARIGAPTIVC